MIPLLLWQTIATAQKTYDIDVTVYNIRNAKGVVNIGLFRDQHTFKKEKPWKLYLVSKKQMKNGTVRYIIKNIPGGVYGVSILDDENENGVMDYRLMMPKEGFGFGDFYLTGMKKPKFDDFKFELNSDKKMKAKIRYVQ